MAKGTGPYIVACYHCRKSFEVGGMAMSTSCPHCHKPVIVEDVVVTNYKPVKKLQTCGKLIIKKNGRVVADLIEAQQGVEIESGAIQAKVLSGGPVHIGPKAEWKGDCSAPSLTLKAGAKVLGGFFSIPQDPLNMAEIHRANVERRNGG